MVIARSVLASLASLAPALVACALGACNGILGNTPGHPYDDAGLDGGSGSDAPTTCDVNCSLITLVAGADCPADLAVANGNVYWVDQGSAQNSTMDGVVEFSPIGGCQATDTCNSTLASGEHSPSALVVNKDSIWWSTIEIPTSRSAIRTLKFGETSPTVFATFQNFPRSMAIDPTALYWLNGGDSAPTANGEVRRAFVDTPGSTAISFGLDSPVSITVHGSALFWTNDGDSDTTGYVMTSDLTGSPSQRIAANQSHPRGISVGGTYVYWANTGDGTIMRALPDGSSITRLFSDLATPSDVAVDDDGIYWVEAGTSPAFADGKVKAARLDGSNVRTIATRQPNPRRIVVDATNLYWIARGTPGCEMHDGSVMQTPKPW